MRLRCTHFKQDDNVWLVMNGDMLIQKVMFGGFCTMIFLSMMLMLLYLHVSA